jgi:hypothetical protein
LRNVSEREENEEEAGSPKDLIMILDSIVHWMMKIVKRRSIAWNTFLFWG